MANASVCLTFDFDAVSPWILEEQKSPTRISEGLFGVRTGVPRVLDLLDEYDISATFFTPGHTLDSFPERSKEVWEAGHNIQHHGWTHTNPSEFEDREAEKADIERGIESIERITGRKPTGYRSPAWDFSQHTLSILQELGFEWDSSQMADDYTPYYVRQEWSAPSDAPYDPGTQTDILEFPVSWKRDDYPAFSFHWGEIWGFADPSMIFSRWADEFDWMHENVEDGVYILTMHPQVVGQGAIIQHLETFIQHVYSKPDVEFRTLDAVASEWTA